jgi:hypothetical protein
MLSLLIAGITFFIYPFPLDSLGNQSTAMVRGTVIERPLHKPVAGAVVYAASREGGVQTTRSDRLGNFYFLTLPPGHYGFWADERLSALDCDVLERAKELNAGFEYVVTINVGHGCYVGP